MWHGVDLQLDGLLRTGTLVEKALRRKGRTTHVFIGMAHTPGTEEA